VLQQTAVKLSNHIITISEDARKRIASRYGCNSKISVIENGVDTEEFRDLRLDRSDVILFVGNIRDQFERKGISTLLEAMSMLGSDFPALRLVMIGTTSRRLELETERLGLREKVDGLGFLSRKDLVRWYNRALALVLPSRFEGYGLVANEAMACSTPVVVSDGVPASKIVKQSGAGFIFPVGNAQALSDCIRILISNRKLARELGLRGHHYVNAELNWERVSGEYLSFFRRIAKTRLD